MARSDQQAGPDRVVFVLTHTAPGGLLELWQDLAVGLRARGHAVDLLAFYPEDDPQGQARHEPGWTYILPRRPRSVGDALRLMCGLWRCLRRERPRVVITAMPFAGIVMSLMGRFAAFTPVVATHHSPSFTYPPRMQWIERQVRVLGNVLAIVCVSPSVADSFRPPARYASLLKVIRNALPREVEAQLAALRAGRAGRITGRRAVAVGRLAPQKNYPVLLRAMAQLDDITLDIIGEGDDRAALMAQAQALGLGDRVVFRGLLSRAETLRLAAASDVFVQPSRYEGHSLALIEAACLGLPLVVSDVPTQVEGVTTRAGEVCGQIAGVDDDRALAQALRRVLDDGEARARWTAAAIRLGQDSAVDAMIAGYHDLVEAARKKQVA
jgi:glycosyltransferase involved in cell wall biosynthesis